MEGYPKWMKIPQSRIGVLKWKSAGFTWGSVNGIVFGEIKKKDRGYTGYKIVG